MYKKLLITSLFSLCVTVLDASYNPAYATGIKQCVVGQAENTFNSGMRHVTGIFEGFKKSAETFDAIGYTVNQVEKDFGSIRRIGERYVDTVKDIAGDAENLLTLTDFTKKLKSVDQQLKEIEKLRKAGASEKDIERAVSRLQGLVSNLPDLRNESATINKLEGKINQFQTISSEINGDLSNFEGLSKALTSMIEIPMPDLSILDDKVADITSSIDDMGSFIEGQLEVPELNQVAVIADIAQDLENVEKYLDGIVVTGIDDVVNLFGLGELQAMQDAMFDGVASVQEDLEAVQEAYESVKAMSSYFNGEVPLSPRKIRNEIRQIKSGIGDIGQYQDELENFENAIGSFQENFGQISNGIGTISTQSPNLQTFINSLLEREEFGQIRDLLQQVKQGPEYIKDFAQNMQDSDKIVEELFSLSDEVEQYVSEEKLQEQLAFVSTAKEQQDAFRDGVEKRIDGELKPVHDNLEKIDQTAKDLKKYNGQVKDRIDGIGDMAGINGWGPARDQLVSKMSYLPLGKVNALALSAGQALKTKDDALKLVSKVQSFSLDSTVNRVEGMVQKYSDMPKLLSQMKEVKTVTNALSDAQNLAGKIENMGQDMIDGIASCLGFDLDNVAQYVKRIIEDFMVEQATTFVYNTYGEYSNKIPFLVLPPNNRDKMESNFKALLAGKGGAVKVDDIIEIDDAALDLTKDGWKKDLEEWRQENLSSVNIGSVEVLLDEDPEFQKVLDNDFEIQNKKSDIDDLMPGLEALQRQNAQLEQQEIVHKDDPIRLQEIRDQKNDVRESIMDRRAEIEEIKGDINDRMEQLADEYSSTNSGGVNTGTTNPTNPTRPKVLSGKELIESDNEFGSIVAADPDYQAYNDNIDMVIEQQDIKRAQIKGIELEMGRLQGNESELTRLEGDLAQARQDLQTMDDEIESYQNGIDNLIESLAQEYQNPTPDVRVYWQNQSPHSSIKTALLNSFKAAKQEVSLELPVLAVVADAATAQPQITVPRIITDDRTGSSTLVLDKMDPRSFSMSDAKGIDETDVAGFDVMKDFEYNPFVPPIPTLDFGFLRENGDFSSKLWSNLPNASFPLPWFQSACDSPASGLGSRMTEKMVRAIMDGETSYQDGYRRVRVCPSWHENSSRCRGWLTRLVPNIIQITDQDLQEYEDMVASGTRGIEWDEEEEALLFSPGEKSVPYLGLGNTGCWYERQQCSPICFFFGCTGYEDCSFRYQAKMGCDVTMEYKEPVAHVEVINRNATSQMASNMLLKKLDYFHNRFGGGESILGLDGTKVSDWETGGRDRHKTLQARVYGISPMARTTSGLGLLKGPLTMACKTAEMVANGDSREDRVWPYLASGPVPSPEIGITMNLTKTITQPDWATKWYQSNGTLPEGASLPAMVGTRTHPVNVLFMSERHKAMWNPRVAPTGSTPVRDTKVGDWLTSGKTLKEVKDEIAQIVEETIDGGEREGLLQHSISYAQVSDFGKFGPSRCGVGGKDATDKTVCIDAPTPSIGPGWGSLFPRTGQFFEYDPRYPFKHHLLIGYRAFDIALERGMFNSTQTGYNTKVPDVEAGGVNYQNMQINIDWPFQTERFAVGEYPQGAITKFQEQEISRGRVYQGGMLATLWKDTKCCVRSCCEIYPFDPRWISVDDWRYCISGLGVDPANFRCDGIRVNVGDIWEAHEPGEVIKTKFYY